jgi:hypothetical protein
MKSLYNFIIKPLKDRYENIKEIKGKQLIVNTSIENHIFISKKAVVVSTPAAYASKIKVGDNVYVHHNIFRRYYDVRGIEKNSGNYFKEDMYFCYLDQVYMYKRNENWVAMPGYCFVNPIQSEDKWENKEEPLKGIVVYTDGSDIVKKGELVGFTPYSEFEFIVGDKRLYRIKLNDISIKYEHKGTEKLYNTSWL